MCIKTHLYFIQIQKHQKIVNIMDTTDLKVLTFNAATMALSFSELEEVLKILLLVASIGYTMQKWWIINRKRKED
jgi:hypothetical protein